MNRWRTLFVLTVVVAVIAIPVQDELAERFNLATLPTPILVAITVGLVASALAFGAEGAAPSRSEGALVRRLNQRSQHLAERLIDDSRSPSVGFNDLFGPVGANGAPVTPRTPIARRLIVLVGPAGSGKSVALARMATELCGLDRPVFYGHASELWPFGSSVGPPRPLDQAIVAALQRRGINPLLAGQWIEEGSLVVLIDGANETDHDPGSLLASVAAFHAKYELCGVLAAQRDQPSREVGGAFDIWSMPTVPKRVVRRQLEQSAAYRAQPLAGRALAEDVCANPLFLSMCVESAAHEAPIDAGDRDRLRQTIIESTVRRRLGWDAEGLPNEEAVFACWLARTMGSRSLGSTLELRSITWRMLQPSVQRTVRALSLFLLGVPVFITLSAVGIVLGLGIAAIGAAAVFMAMLYVIATRSRSGLRFVTHREIVRKRRWSVSQVLAFGMLSVQRVSSRLALGLALGLPIGTIFIIMIAVVPDGMVGNPWFIWLSLTTIPVLVLLHGALIGGMLAGTIVAVAFGLTGSYVDALIGGVVAGGTGGSFFALVDLGDISTPPVITRHERVSRTITTSAWELTKFDVVVWTLFGALYGGMNWLAHSGSLNWGYHGLGTGVSGAVLFGSIALVSPVSSYAITDFGLRRSQLLHRYSLNGMLARLIETRILVSAGTGAAFRFAHPLIADFLASLPPIRLPGSPIGVDLHVRESMGTDPRSP